jgi:hypothetical protein
LLQRLTAKAPFLQSDAPALAFSGDLSVRRSHVNDEFSPALAGIPRAAKFYDPLADAARLGSAVSESAVGVLAITKRRKLMTDSTAVPTQIRAAIMEVLNYCTDEEAHYEASPERERLKHVWKSIVRVRDWMGATGKKRAKPEYTIGVHNDDGNCYDIAIKQRGRPIATLIATETEVGPLVHAGNCYATLVSALRTADKAIIEVTDLMLYEDDKPVTFLESSDIERAYYSLVEALPEIKHAFNAVAKFPGGSHA